MQPSDAQQIGPVLVVDDEKFFQDLMAGILMSEGYEVRIAGSGEEALKAVRKEKFNLIILDLMLPGVQGMELCSMLRSSEETSSIPVIMLTAKSEELDKVLGLEMGADDYVTKPFSPRELIARIRVILRRGRESLLDEKIERGNIIIDSARHKIIVSNEEVVLTFTEFKLLEFMARRPGIVFSRDQILDAISGDNTIVTDRTVDAHIKSLRHKLGKAKDYIETVRGAGYRFKEGPYLN